MDFSYCLSLFGAFTDSLLLFLVKSLILCKSVNNDFQLIKKICIVDYHYFEFILRGGHDSLDGKPGVVKLLASWLFIMPAEAQCQFEIRRSHIIW
jgi:hypothetical protein